MKTIRGWCPRSRQTSNNYRVASTLIRIPDVEVRFRHPADDGREVEDGGGAGIDDIGEQGALRDVADHVLDPRIDDGRRWRDIEEDEPLDRTFLPVRALQRAELQQRAGQPLAKKSGASGNHYCHFALILIE